MSALLSENLPFFLKLIQTVRVNMINVSCHYDLMFQQTRTLFQSLDLLKEKTILASYLKG